MITEDYISFPTAKLLKEKGFMEKGIAFYNTLGQLETIETILSLGGNHSLDYFYRSLNTPEWMKDMCSAPTQALVVKWLRIKHNISVEVGWWKKWQAQIIMTNDLTFHYDLPEDYDTPEAAYEAAIEYCLKNLVK